MNSKNAALAVALFLSAASGTNVVGQTKDVAKPPRASSGLAAEKSARRARDTTGAPISIRGTVVDESGKPVANAQIEEIGRSRLHGRVSARADGSGNFTLVSSVPNFERWVIARDEASARMGFGSFIFVEGGGPLRIVVRKAREIAVNVADGQGRAVSNSKVAAARDMTEGTVTQTQTDAAGKATLRIPAGLPLYCVFAVKQDVGFDYLILEQPQRLIRQQPQRRRVNRDEPTPDLTKPLNLVLDGAQRVRVHVVDESHTPLPGIRVHASQIQRPKKGSPIALTEVEALEGTTNAAGIAEFRTIPTNREPGFNLTCGTPGYSFGGPPLLDRSAPVCDVELVAHRVAVLRVLVTLPDGRPVAGARLSGTYRNALGQGFGNWSAWSDEQGTSQFMTFPNSDAAGAVSATIGTLASPLASFVAHKGQPIPPIHLVVRPATRVHGTVTYGKERHPLAEARITLHQRPESVSGGLPGPEALAGIATDIPQTRETDELGRFEFFAAPGRYRIVDSENGFAQIIGADMMNQTVALDEGSKEFEIRNEPEFELNLQRARPPRVEFDGRVVLESDPKQGVANATVRLSPVDPRNSASSRRPIVSDAGGTFHTTRRPCEMLVEAQTPNGSASGLVHVFADETTVTIPVGAPATARGVLLDATTGQAVGDQRITCGIRLDYPGRGFTLAFQRVARTKPQGEFEPPNLLRGCKYEFYALVGPRGAGTRYVRLGEITTGKTTEIDLGKIKFSALPGAPAPSRAASSKPGA